MRQWCELPLLLLLLLLEGMAAAESSLEGPAPEFRVYWNAPTFMCHRYGMDFSTVRNWGMVQNSGDVFRGEHMVILYDPGEFPALLRDKHGNTKRRNGGVPQEGDLEQHLNKLRAQVDEMVPDRNFQGLGVIDFEAWRPIWRQNWASLLPYRELSREIEKGLHPFWWTPQQIEEAASRRFEKAAREFLLSTLELLKQMRPNGQWGYYTFPYCFNYTPKNMQPACPKEVQHENDEIQWLFDASDAVYPSLYLSKLRMTTDQHVQFAVGRLNEAVRVANNVPRLSKPTVNAYVWYKYHDVDQFLSEEDIHNSLAVARRFKAGGVVIWGSANDTNSRERCKDLEKYVNTVLGPTVKKLSSTPGRSLVMSDPESGGVGSFLRHLFQRLVGRPGE
ncbi:hyaluronidase-like isoform X2 [Periplaneta americana]|uniref:hyaluronidase-like isoform X2 n=1 Tax=Periplaneta americana TaxID=6978 RepID=UPI0037E73208